MTERSRWVGIEEYGGVPTPTRRGDPLPPHWRLDAVWATERPRTPSVSHDRRVVAFVQDRDTSDVWLLELDSGDLRRLTTGRAPAPYWEDMTPVIAPGGDLVAYTEAGLVKVVPTTGGPPRVVTAGAAPVWLDDARLVVSVDRETRGRLAITTIDDAWPQPLVRDGAGLERTGDEHSPAVSPDGTSVAFVYHSHLDLNHAEIRLADVATGAQRVLTGTCGAEPDEAASHKDGSPVWAPDGRSLAYTCQRGEWWQLRLVDPATGEDRALTAGEGDLGEPAWSPDGARIAATRDRGVRHGLVVVDVATGAVSELATGGCYGTPLWADDGTLLATYDDHVTPPELRRLRETTTERVHRVVPAAVLAAPHVEPDLVSFHSTDGLTIEALLYRPTPGTRPAPAVVYPHGGPTEASGDEWDGVAQYFVDKGYAWLALNYRGSTGRGKGFEHLNDLDWGVGDVADCLAAADYLRTVDGLDADRLAIFGASYGSYLALGSVVEDAGERFRCAVCKYGDCDLITTWSQGDWDGIRYCGENMLGHPGPNRDIYLRGSPIHRVDRIAVPLLVATGERDERVHPKQSAELVDALRRLGKTFEYVTYPTEGHGFLREGPFLDFHRRLERFLDWYLL